MVNWLLLIVLLGVLAALTGNWLIYRRITRFFMTIVGLAVFSLGTGICAVTTFGLTQRAVLDLSRTGVPVEDPWLVLRCLLTGQTPCESADAEAPPPNGDPPLLILTPMLTPLPTATAQSNQPAPEATSAFNAASLATALPSPTQSDMAAPD